MGKAGPRPTRSVHGNESDAVLRAKYLDYCSAQVAEHLLMLSPDDIYLLAKEAHRLDGESGTPSYERMVHMATAGVSKRLALPPFEAWAEDYARNPAQYEAYFLGLWESDVDETPDA